jgi:hypothetical protein
MKGDQPCRKAATYHTEQYKQNKRTLIDNRNIYCIKIVYNI